MRVNDSSTGALDVISPGEPLNRSTFAGVAAASSARRLMTATRVPSALAATPPISGGAVAGVKLAPTISAPVTAPVRAAMRTAAARAPVLPRRPYASIRSEPTLARRGVANVMPLAAGTTGTSAAFCSMPAASTAL